MVSTSTAKWSLMVLCLLSLSCSTTKQTSRFLTADCISGSTFRMSDTLDFYYFPPLRPCADNITQPCSGYKCRGDLINSDTSQHRPYHARLIRHATANLEDTTHYQVNEQKQDTKVRQPPAPMLDAGRKIVLSLIIFFGFVFVGILILVIWKLLSLTGSQ